MREQRALKKLGPAPKQQEEKWSASGRNDCPWSRGVAAWPYPGLLRRPPSMLRAFVSLSSLWATEKQKLEQRASAKRNDVKKVPATIEKEK